MTRDYKRVKVTMYFIDNGQGAGYLKLMFPDGDFVKVWPGEDILGTLYELMEEYITNLPDDVGVWSTVPRPEGNKA